MDAYCPACRRSSPHFVPMGERPEGRCPRCQAMERHRFTAVLFDLLSPFLQDARRVLDVAPAPVVRRILSGRFGETTYVGIDLDPDRPADVRTDLTRLPFPDATFDLVFCSHVLEHVPDDRAAMRELARVTADDGIVIVFIPYRAAVPTDEGPLRPGETAEERFGQADHVRWYGHDFEDRLVAEGLEPLRITPADLLTDDEIARFRLVPTEKCWICTPARTSQQRATGVVTALLRGRLADHRDAGLLVPDGAQPVRSMAQLRDRAERYAAGETERADLQARVAAVAAERDRYRERAEHAETVYRRLTRHPVVRTLRALKQTLRR